MHRPSNAARLSPRAVKLTVRFTEEALLDPARPISLGYAVTLKRGQTLNVQVTARELEIARVEFSQ